MAVRYFHPADYGVLVAVLGISSFIGIYFAWKDRRSTNNREFLVGNRKLQVFPVTMSMMASFMSAVAILGVPSESFVHGSQYMINFVGVIVGIVLAAHVFLPVFYEIDMISVNQGGIKAVVWTDVMQMVLMLSGLILVTVQGLIKTGGPAAVLETVNKHGLLEFFE
ncbi:hypothetical protein HPB50_025666 [Hyalomma asiaticum]|uniref:Uncharacterized protein n=1 Tax=Hyalomma asiaticum TaxID=266040 RepID=A0ACB7SA23_HYAAI|nr:hypothetical protein HPB50_025666 [Hyalomma asiaticum]